MFIFFINHNLYEITDFQIPKDFKFNPLYIQDCIAVFIETLQTSECK
jgi:hypothetical protein